MRRTLKKAQYQEALNLLKQGGLVALPTDTVYGLAADASNPEAVQRIYAAKQRPLNRPLNVLIPHKKFMKFYASDIPDVAYELADYFWPGALTLVLKKQDHVPGCITAGRDTIGLRVPDNEIALKLLVDFDGGLACPSANRSGHLSPTLADHVQQDLGDAVDCILDGGICESGIESTLVDCTTTPPRILRCGLITQAMLEKATGIAFCDSHVSDALHYQPSTPHTIQSHDDLTAMTQQDLGPVVILSRHRPTCKKIHFHDGRTPTTWKKIDETADQNTHWIQLPEDPIAYAHALYEQLHFADQLHCQKLIIEALPETDEWQALRDRIGQN